MKVICQDRSDRSKVEKYLGLVVFMSASVLKPDWFMAQCPIKGSETPKFWPFLPKHFWPDLIKGRLKLEAKTISRLFFYL